MAGLGTITVDAFSGNSPWDSPGNWDSITIGGVVYGLNSPDSNTPAQQSLGTQVVPIANSFLPVGGKVRIRGASRFYKFDIKNPPGSDGWTMTYRGIEPKDFYIDFFIWTGLQYDYFVNNVIPAITYSGTKKTVQPVIVQHPALDAVSIYAIIMREIGSVEPVNHDSADMYKCTLRVCEYLRPPPVNTTATPVAVKATNQLTTPGLVPLTASEQRLKIIEALNARVAADGLPAPFGGPVP